MGGKIIAIKIIAVAVIRKCSLGKITGLRKSTKKVLADAIVQYRAGKEHEQVHGSLHVIPIFSSMASIVAYGSKDS